MKIIDWERKGNLIKLYLGQDDLSFWYGDDWDDAPYQHNAGRVYDKFVSGYKIVAIPWKYNVYEIKDLEPNIHYSKADMRNRKIPILIIAKENLYRTIEVLSDPETILIFMGDEPDILQRIIANEL